MDQLPMDQLPLNQLEMDQLPNNIALGQKKINSNNQGIGNEMLVLKIFLNIALGHIKVN